MKTRSNRILPSDITPESVYFNRRQLLATGMGSLGLAALAPVACSASAPPPLAPLAARRNEAMSVSEELNSYSDIISYNNYYEFGVEKEDPAQLSRDFKPTPWSVTVDGEAEVTGKLALEDILKPHALEERVYRLRCVEGWSMVIPWVGFPLADLLQRFKPTSKAKYVEFTTLRDAKRMPGQRTNGLGETVLNWPYTEGLRMDEAMHPLTFMVVGLYGRVLPNQNGAPLRLVTPWKYGFKNIKAIVRIRFTSRQPLNTWQVANSTEYGFFGNVNPAVDHPRWTQATERRIGSTSLLGRRIDTLPFNGYAEQVASLYAGMNPRMLY